MKFQVLDLLPELTGDRRGIRPDKRYSQALTSARYAEEFGCDAVALGERHAGRFLSSGVTVLLGAIAATSQGRIQTGVSVLSIHDPNCPSCRCSASRTATSETRSPGEVRAAAPAVARGERHLGGPFPRPDERSRKLPRLFACAPRVWHGSATTLTSASEPGRAGGDSPAVRELNRWITSRTVATES